MSSHITKSILFFFFIIGQYVCRAQNDVGYRPKIAEFSIENLIDYKTTSSSEILGMENAEIENDLVLKLKLGAPIKLKGRTKLALQFKYYRQHFDINDTNYEIGNKSISLFNRLDNSTFLNAGLRFLYTYDLTKIHKLTFVAGSEIKSDQLKINNQSTLYFLSGNYTKQLSNSKKIGFGIYLARSLAVNSIYPLFIYESKISNNLTLDLLLPKSASLRYKLNEKSYLIAKASINGFRYNLSKDNVNFTLRKSDVRFTLTYEREIHDWLWFGLEAGYNKNLRYVLTHSGERSRNAFANLASNDATFLKFSFFIVPPKKFFNKF